MSKKTLIMRAWTKTRWRWRQYGLYSTGSRFVFVLMNQQSNFGFCRQGRISSPDRQPPDVKDGFVAWKYLKMRMIHKRYIHFYQEFI